MILRTQFKGIGAFCKRKRLAGEVGGLIVHQAKRLPLLKFPRKKIKKLDATVNFFSAIAGNIDLSRIPVNKGTNSRLGWTKYSDLYETVHPSLVLISLCLFTGA